jgi:superfamily II DNA or RNA helicase
MTDTLRQSAEPLAIGQRIRLRGRVWEVEGTSDGGNGQLLSLRDVASPLDTLRVVSGVERIEALPAPALAGALAPHRDWKILHDALTLTQRPAPGDLVGFDQAKITVEDYQLFPTIRAFRRPMQRILIADDVGLGKTVEAIVLMLELRARRRADRVLVVCPAGLQDQWCDELLDKAGLDFELFDAQRVREVAQQHQRGENPWDACRRIVTSIDYVKRTDVRRRLRDPKWNLVIVDEAHYLSETSSGNKVYRTARSRFGQFIARQTDSLVLLTATPHTGDPQSFYSLISLIDDKLVASPGEMTRERTEPIVIRRYKKDIRDPHDPTRSRFPGIDVQTIAVPFGSEEEAEVYRLVHRYTQRRWKRAGADTALGFAMTVIKKRLVSSRAALVATLESRKDALSDEPVDVDVKRGLVADYRAGAPLTEEETALAESRVVGAPPIDAEDRARERKELDRLIAAARAVPSDDAKATHLLQELNFLTAGASTGTPEKVIIFTEFRDTHSFLKEFLERHGYAARIATLTGAHNRAERAAQIERFAQPGVDVLLATDAASEGLNLQEHCRVVCHYELPWNPNRLEQRNGRVHRYGQRKDVIVRNFALVDTLDARILELLLEKTQRIYEELGSAGDVIGVMAGVDWENLLMSTSGLVADAEKAEIELARAHEEIERESERSKRELLAWQDRAAPRRSSFDGEAARAVEEACATSAYLRLSPQRRRAIVERFVTVAGGRIQNTDGGTVRVVVPQRLRVGVPEIIDRAVFDPGDIPHGAGRVEYLSAQHPLLQAIGVTARAALYDPATPLAGARLSAKVAEVPNAGVLFTFSVRFATGDGETHAEELLPVFVPEGMPIASTAVEDRALFEAPEFSGAPQSGVVERLQATLFVERRDEAEHEAVARAAIRAREFSSREEARSVQLVADVKRWAAAKRNWLERQLAPTNREMALALDDDTATARREDDEAYRRQRRRFEQELETLDIAARERLEHIAKHRVVLAPERVELIGALFVIPTFETLEAR